MSSNHTDPAVRLLAERLWKEYDSQYSASHLTWVDFEPEARGHLEALREAGNTVTPQASSAERSEESLVSAVAEGLRDFKFEVGPITFEMLRVGQAVYLTPEERHQIAHAAVRAHRQVVADE